jgi:hypothetical protein
MPGAVDDVYMASRISANKYHAVLGADFIYMAMSRVEYVCTQSNTHHTLTTIWLRHIKPVCNQRIITIIASTFVKSNALWGGTSRSPPIHRLPTVPVFGGIIVAQFCHPHNPTSVSKYAEGLLRQFLVMC